MTDSQAPEQFLTPEESAEVDRAMLTARDRFSARVSIYSLRALKQIGQQQEVPIEALQAETITNWVEQDPTLQPEQGFDSNFKRFFSRLVISSLKPLKQIAVEREMAIETLTPAQVITWFEKEAKLRIEQGSDATFLKQ
ncbi:MAG: hypothetical protein HC881_16060 [Leptolyngbyaceae cyanobacterium SL_7_1]|nr:hypothetical protein [Leptolyngbyaceae cyanobacterium SL_7_1]